MPVLARYVLLDKLGDVTGPVRDAIGIFAGTIPGPRWVAWVLALVLAAALAWLIASRPARRRAALALSATGRGVARGDSPTIAVYRRAKWA